MMTSTASPSRFSSLLDAYDVFIFDLSGTLYEGRVDVDLVKETLSGLKRKGKKIVFLSNMPRPWWAPAARLEKLGLDLNGIEIYTSGDHFLADWQSLRAPSGATPTFFPLGDDRNTDLLRDVKEMKMAPLAQADFVILMAYVDLHETAYHQQVCDHLRVAFERGLTVLCTNPDKTVATPAGRRLSGYFAGLYEEWGGKVIYYGKPYRETYAWLMEKLAAQGYAEKSSMLMIGDNLETDILGGNQAGLDTLLVLTGVSSREDIKASLQPTYILDDLRWGD